MSSLVVVIDFAQPESYLTRAPTCELARDLGIEVQWRPTVVQPPPPPSPAEGAHDRGTRHLRLRALYRERDLERYADVQGLKLSDLYRTDDSSLVGMGLLWLEKRAPERVDELVARVFDGFWQEGLDIEHLSVARTLLASVGADADEFDPQSMRAEYEALQADLGAAGVLSAPSYLLDGELFLGRAHLPMIRWLLEGKEGSPPI